jgi:hypothetical protein
VTGAFVDALERARDPLGVRAWTAAWRAAERVGAPSCPECGTNLVDAGRALCQRPVYCSNACKQRAYRRRVTADRQRVTHSP